MPIKVLKRLLRAAMAFSSASAANSVVASPMAGGVAQLNVRRDNLRRQGIKGFRANGIEHRMKLLAVRSDMTVNKRVAIFQLVESLCHGRGFLKRAVNRLVTGDTRKIVHVAEASAPAT